jgi:hypothetical protein
VDQQQGWHMAFTQTNTLDNTMMGPYSIDTISVGTNTVTIAPSSTSVMMSGTAGPMWTDTTMMSVSQQHNSGIVELRGEKADIRVNGESMMQTLRDIQDRLNMLRPNPELEAEWDQLRALGEQYRKLESEFKEKSKMWNTLKK